jgi:hypothetical protein
MTTTTSLLRDVLLDQLIDDSITKGEEETQSHPIPCQESQDQKEQGENEAFRLLLLPLKHWFRFSNRTPTY